MKKIIFITFIFLVTINYSFAGWPVGKYRSIFGLGYNHYYSNKIYDANWLLKDSNNPNDYFRSEYISFYVAHGVTRRLDFIGNASYVFQTAQQGGNITKRSDLGDAMLGLAYSIENKDYTKYITFQLSGIFPMYSNPTGKLPMGYAAHGIDFTINYNINPKFLKNDGYLMYQLSYRNYFTTDGPQQLIADASIAFIIRRSQQLILNMQGVGSFSTNTTTNINPKEVKDYETFKLNASYGIKLRRTIILYGSAFYTFAGRNISQGLGLGANVIIKIP